MNKFNKIITYILIFVLCFSLVATVYADDSVSVESLPVDIDLTVSYDADYISFTYAGVDYKIHRDFVLDHGSQNHFYASSSRTEQTVDVPSSAPYSYERDYNGNVLKTSYWFSPSEMVIYVVMPWWDSTIEDSCGYVNRYSAGGSYGAWGFTNATDNTLSDGFMSVSFATIYLDSDNYIDNDGCYVGSDYVSGGSSYSYRYYINSTSLTDNYVNHVNHIRRGSSYYTGAYDVIPADLICIYANYNIDGFYEITADNVVTPSYYMNYQYLYYSSNGFVFFDCSSPIVRTYVNSNGNSTFVFRDQYTNYNFYRSSDGVSWTRGASIRNMRTSNYARSIGIEAFNNILLSDGVFSATLLYTNDSSIDLGYSWDSLDTVLSAIYGNRPGYAGNDFINWGGIVGQVDNLSDSTVYNNVSYVTNLIDSIAGTDSTSFLHSFVGLIASLTGNSDVFGDYNMNPTDWALQSIDLNLSSDFYYYWLEDDNGNWYLASKPSIYGYIYDIDYGITQMLTYLSNYQSLFLGINDNLSGMFAYIQDQNASLNSIKSDFTKALNYMKQEINKQGVTNTKLDSIIDSVTGFDISSVVNAINDIDTDGVIAAIEGQDIPTLTLTNTLLAGILAELEFDSDDGLSLSDLIQLILEKLTDIFDSNTAEDDFSAIADLIDQAQEDLSFTSFSAGDPDLDDGIFNGALAFDSDILSGINVFNSTLMGFYDELQPFSSIFSIGVVVSVLNTALRKESYA